MKKSNYINPLALYNPSSPAGRKEFFWGLVIYPGIVSLGYFILFSLFVGREISYEEFYSFFFIVLIIANCLMPIRRLREMGKPWWLVLIGVVPLIFDFVYLWPVFFLWLLFSKGGAESTPTSDILEHQRDKITTSSPIKCSYCGSLNLGSEIECIHCTAKLNVASASSSVKKQQPRLGRKGLLILIFFVITIFTAILYFVDQNKTPETFSEELEAPETLVPYTLGDASRISHLVLTTDDLVEFGFDFWTEDPELEPLIGLDNIRCEFGCAGRSWYSDHGTLDINISEHKTDAALNSERKYLISEFQERGGFEKFSVDYLPVETYLGYFQPETEGTKFSLFSLVSTDKNYMITIWEMIDSDRVEDEDFQLHIKIVTQLAKTQWEKINNQ
jgi:uncharacterized membrane protein YhaH (DUF805 family)